MRIVIISDTHGRHDDLPDLAGDLLIHCGDVEGAAELDAWFASQSFEKIVVIGGNHDYDIFEANAEDRQPFYNADYLQDSVAEFQGFKIYGSPWINDLEGAAFSLNHCDIERKWRDIPQDTDILVTHVPPFGILDRARYGDNWGCSLLRERIEDLNLRFHCFGHVHASYGQDDLMGITFYNAANISGGEISNPPIVIDL